MVMLIYQYKNMNWYVIHSKPRQEQRAFDNLVRQGFECYLPKVTLECVRRGALKVVEEALFPRYLFIQLDTDFGSGKGWGSIRSTLGVSRLVTFGTEAARAPDHLIEALRAMDGSRSHPRRLFSDGETVQVKSGPFAGLEGVYQLADGEARAFMLVELLSKQVKLPVKPEDLKKLS